MRALNCTHCTVNGEVTASNKFSAISPGILLNIFIALLLTFISNISFAQGPWIILDKGVKASGNVHFRMEAMPMAEAANLDQIRNGAVDGNPPPCGNCWVNGNAGPENAHYTEGWSIPYRMVITGLTPGTHNIKIEWDI